MTNLMTKKMSSIGLDTTIKETLVKSVILVIEKPHSSEVPHGGQVSLWYHRLWQFIDQGWG